jgi:hypothetical protein
MTLLLDFTNPNALKYLVRKQPLNRIYSCIDLLFSLCYYENSNESRNGRSRSFYTVLNLDFAPKFLGGQLKTVSTDSLQGYVLNVNQY